MPKKLKHTHMDAVFRYAESLGYGDIYTRIDHRTGLKAIIVIHNLKRGSAIGGCRFLPYESLDAALEDALRLGQMMSYKAAISQLDHGGAKAVLMRPAVIKNREAYFKAFGEFVNELNGKYITAIDSGTLTSDMKIIYSKTPYVTSVRNNGEEYDPSPFTALGIRRGIEAVVNFKLNRESLEGIHVLIQGAGHVGFNLAKALIEKGAKVSVSDINEEALKRLSNQLNVTPISPNEIYETEADVFAPCALGGILTPATIEKLKVKMVAGSANNQLAHKRCAQLMKERDILYAPDFVINAGGLIYVATLYDYNDEEKAKKAVYGIYDTLLEIFIRAQNSQSEPNQVAFELAEARLHSN